GRAGALGRPPPAVARAELATLDTRVPGGPAGHPAPPTVPAAVPATAARGHAVLATWRQLIDAGSLQDGEPHLAGTARPARALLSPATATEIGAAAGDRLTVSTDRGELTLPLSIVDLPERVVWLPANAAGSGVHRTPGVTAGAVVAIRAGGGAA